MSSAFLLALLLLLTGCGGGGKSAKGTTSGKTPTGNGRTTITILWPNTTSGRNSRLIPANTQSISITITAPNYSPPVAMAVIDAPTTPDPDGVKRTHNTFTQLPTGTLRLTAKAYDVQGKQVAQADTNLIIRDGETTPAPITLISAATKVEIVAPPGFVNLVPRQFIQLGIRATAADGSSIVPIAASDLAWNSDNPKSVTVDGNGVATATDVTGTSNITVTAFPNATDASKITSVSFPIVVKVGGVDSISIVQKSPFTLPVTASQTLTADVRDSSGNPINLTGLKWSTVPPNSSSDVLQLNPDTGVVTGLTLGTALVNVTDPASKKSSPPIQINVGPGNLDHVTITPSAGIVFNRDDSRTLTASAQDKSGNQITISPSNFVWTIDNKSVAVVSNNGVSTDDTSGVSVTGTSVMVKGKTRGSANITVTEIGSGKKSTPPIVVTLNIAVTINPIDPVLVKGTVKCTALVTGDVPNSGVNWSIMEGASGGSIDSTGVYKAQTPSGAPINPGIYHVIATSQADSSQKDTQPVTVSLGSGTVIVK